MSKSESKTSRSASPSNQQRYAEELLVPEPGSLVDGAKARAILRGIAVSPGVVVSTAYCVHETTIAMDTEGIDDDHTVKELARFNEAREKTLSDLHVAHEKVAAEIGPQEAAIFQSHAMMLGDDCFADQVARYISERHQNAESALQSVIDEYIPVFAAMKSEYLRERTADLRDIARRLREALSNTRNAGLDSIAGILVTDELLPSDLIPLEGKDIHGIVTETGGRTGHAAILARSRGIPAVSGIEGLLNSVQSGDSVIVDGHEGVVYVAPDSETEHAYRKLQREFVHLKHKLTVNRDPSVVTADHQSVELLANVSSQVDAKWAGEVGAAGVGLFRTEYLFLGHPSIPDEEEQFNAYRGVIDASPGSSFTIRTIDLGGDKIHPYIGYSGEHNPAMGLRSIRLCFEYPELFVRQIRAILRAVAGVEKVVRLLFPMITTRDEILRAREIVRRTRSQLGKEGVAHGSTQLGLMVEVPAAAIALHTMLDTVDFVSFGTNDLVQYITAADRDNPRVSQLCQPMNPAVLRVLTKAMEACRRSNTPATICGEMAASPKTFLLLFGMGFRSFSMSPAFIPMIKELVVHLNEKHARQILERTLLMNTSRQVSRFVGQHLKTLAPTVSILG